MIKENLTVKKSRYFSIRQDGIGEIYVENLPSTESMKKHLKLCRKRLEMVRKAMPEETWSMVIEQQWKEGEDSHFQIMDVETGEIQEQVL